MKDLKQEAGAAQSCGELIGAACGGGGFEASDGPALPSSNRACRATCSTEAFKGILRGKSNASLDKEKAKAKEAKDSERSLLLEASKLSLERVL